MAMETMLHAIWECEDLLIEFQVANQHAQCIKEQTSCGGVEIWKHPPVGIFKLNVDEATSLKGLNRGVRIVIRDETGVVMVGCSKQIHGRFDALTTELLAAKEGQVFAYDAGFHAIVLQLDAIGTVDLINAASVRFDRDDSILEEIVDLKSQFSLFSCQWQGRDGKIVAQELAKYELSNRGFNTWMEKEPLCLFPFLEIDLENDN